MSTSCARTISEFPKQLPLVLPPILERVVFRCGDAVIRVGDVLDEAWLRGDLGGAWRELQDGEAFEVIASGLGLELEGGELQAWSEVFRYDRELLTAEETERWLEARGLDEGDFVAHLGFSLLAGASAGTHGHRPGGIRGHGGGTAGAVGPRGHVQRCVRDLGRGALLAVGGRGGGRSRGGPRRRRRANATRSCPGTAGNRANWRDSSAAWAEDDAWLAGVLAREAAFRRSSARRLTPAVLARALESRRIPLTRVTLETLVAPSLNAGREAVFCVRQGERTMGELAAECGFEFGSREVLLGDCPEGQQRMLLAALPGEVLEPVPIAGGFAVTRLVDKVEPDPQHPETRARVEREWLKAEFTTLAAERVGWVLGDGRSA